jgi:hypothetical protein
MEPEVNTSQINNFKKINFKFQEVDYELAISLYSKLIFIIITESSKLGNMYIGELEGETINDEENDFYDFKCILGDRNNEPSQFLANNVINLIFSSLKKIGNTKIQKILISSTLKKDCYCDKDGLTGEFKNFLNIVKENITTLLNI